MIDNSVPGHQCSGEPPGGALKRAGSARAHGHFGEILQGQFVDGGSHVHALVTLPFSTDYATAVLTYDPEGDGVAVVPEEYTKAGRAVSETLLFLGRRGGAAISMDCDLPPGGGCGSSSACVHAAIQAVADAFDTSIRPVTATQIALASEGAVDPVHLAPRALLFAQLEGRVLEDLGGDLPPMFAIGIFDGESVDTLSFERPVYTSDELEAFGVLRAAMRRAIADQDAGLVGRVATASARINQRYLRKPRLLDVIRVADANGAAGVCVAHTGSAMAILFDSQAQSRDDVVRASTADLEGLGFVDFLKFDIANWQELDQ